MERRHAIAAGTVLLGIALTASEFWQDKIAPPALAAAGPVAVQPAAQPPAAVRPAQPPQSPATVAALPRAEPVAPLLPAPQAEAADECLPAIDLVHEDDAMIGVTIVAPCHPGERVVLAHEGLAITLRSTATGSLFTSIPALSTLGDVTARWPDGTEASASLRMPEAAEVRRFVVQFPGSDPMALNAYAPGAEYGGAGHVRPVALSDLPAGASPRGAVLALGAADVALPLLAHVYTYPEGDWPLLTIEAEVTEATCARDLLGEAIESQGGGVVVQDLTLTMPDCDAIGEFLVLNIAPEDLTLARAE